MKKYSLLLLIVCVLLCGCQTKPSTKIEEISFSEFETLLTNKQNFTLIIGRDDCPHCVQLKDFISNSDLDITSPMYLKYTTSEKETILPQLEEYFGTIQIIPYYALIQDGKIIKTGQGFTNADTFNSFLENS